MAFSKAPYFDATLFSQSTWAKAFAHPARIIILTYLLENRVTPFHTLARNIPLAKTTVSQHLRLLRDLSLIESFEKHPHTYYHLNQKACKPLAMLLGQLNTGFANMKDNTSMDQPSQG